MDAIEARRKALENCDSEDKENYNNVMGSIIRSIDDGYFETNYYSEIRLRVKERLLKEGYKLEHVSSGYNEYTWVIKW